jgi:dTMP kinase
MVRGKLIVFEGLDRAGKSTQCQLLVDALQKDGVKVKHMRFPGTFSRSFFLKKSTKTCFYPDSDLFTHALRGLICNLDRTTPIGQMINSYLSGKSEQEDHVIHLLFSANRWEVA